MKLKLPNSNNKEERKEKALKIIRRLKPETLEAIANKISIKGCLIIGVDKMIVDGLKNLK